MTSLVANSNRFTCCVNGESDFVEEYGPEDENSEWRRVPDQVAAAAAYKLAEKLFVQKEQREKREAEEAEVRRLEELAKEQAAAAEAEAANAPAAEAPAAAGKKRKNPPKAEGGTTKTAKKAPAVTTTASATAVTEGVGGGEGGWVTATAARVRACAAHQARCGEISRSGKATEADLGHDARARVARYGDQPRMRCVELDHIRYRRPVPLWVNHVEILHAPRHPAT